MTIIAAALVGGLLVALGFFLGARYHDPNAFRALPTSIRTKRGSAK